MNWTPEDLDGLKRLRVGAEKALAQIKAESGKRPDWCVNWPVVWVVSVEWALQEDGSGIHRVWVGKGEDRKLEEEMERLLKAEGWTSIEVTTEW